MNKCPNCNNASISNMQMVASGFAGGKIECNSCHALLKIQSGLASETAIHLIVNVGIFVAAPVIGLYFESWYLFCISVVVIALILFVLIVNFTSLKTHKIKSFSIANE